MAGGFTRVAGETRRYPPSSHSNRADNSRLQMTQQHCRNGPQCRKFQEGTCNYNHDFASLAPNGLINSKKSLSADSPSFMPKAPETPTAKALGISPTTAAAAVFTPRGSGSVTPAATAHAKEPSAEFIPPIQSLQPPSTFNEFVPGQNFVPQQQISAQGGLQSQLPNYSDAFLNTQSMAGMESVHGQVNPYTQASSVTNQAFYSDTAAYQHPLNYHLYAAVGPKREKSHPYQRTTSDFFVSDDLRETLQRKSEASLQVFANSTLPQSVEYFHSLVVLDTNAQKNNSLFGLPTSIYKAVSSKDGRIYALRRVEGFRLTNEAAIRSTQVWKRIDNANIVRIYDFFTGRWFGDSSLVIVTDYHPLAQTVADKFLQPSRLNHGSRSHTNAPSEQDLWAYIVQMVNALHTIHEAGLAAQTIHSTKVLVISKNRLRLNCCGILDILRYDHRQSPAELQRTDLEDLGRLILSIATRTPNAHQNWEKASALLARTYSDRLRACISWLLNPPTTDNPTNAEGMPVPSYTVTTLLESIADKVLSTMDSGFHHEDVQTSELMRELENARLVRLMAKLNVILERPEISLIRTGNDVVGTSSNTPQSHAWSETGERYILKLFRDYVFHQLDSDGRPVLDLGHIITCLNKLDAGLDERMQLVSRDEQSTFILTYRDVKRAVESAWAEISKAASSTTRR